MKMTLSTKALSLLLLAGLSTSCATIKTTASSAASKVSSFAKLPDIDDTPLAKILPGRGIRVVEVREKDLEDLPTGKERAIAYRQKRSNFWIFGGPVDFVEPELPELGADMDGGLLPPRPN